jgi:hypothetical protein
VINTLTLAEVIRVEIQEVHDNQYHFVVSLDEKLHFYLLKIREVSKTSIIAAMYNHQQVPIAYPPFAIRFYAPHVHLRRAVSCKPTMYPIPLVIACSSESEIGLIGNTTNQFPLINNRHYFELRTTLPTFQVKGISRYLNDDDEEIVLLVMATHIHPYHTLTGMKLPAYAFREGFRCVAMTIYATTAVAGSPWIAIGCTNGHILLYHGHTFGLV